MFSNPVSQHMKNQQARKAVTPAQNDYQVFMLKIWPAIGTQFSSEENIRLTIENVIDGQRISFRNWDELVSFIKQQTVGSEG